MAKVQNDSEIVKELSKENLVLNLSKFAAIAINLGPDHEILKVFNYMLLAHL